VFFLSCILLPLTVVVGKTLEKSLFLKNNSEYAVAFKVKTTAPKRYCVRPNSSVIKAHESIEVRIVMQVCACLLCMQQTYFFAPGILPCRVLADSNMIGVSDLSAPLPQTPPQTL
jgi:hypothetical protein